MSEYIPENEHPMNQRAKQLLLQVGERPDLDMLYIPQLMDWAMRTNQADPESRFGFILEEAVETMKGAPPENVMKLLLWGGTDDEVTFQSNGLDDLDPAEAAATLFVLLDEELDMWARS